MFSCINELNLYFLELKLKNLRKHERNVSAQDILKDLQAGKDDHLLHGNQNGSSYETAYDVQENHSSILNGLGKDFGNPEELEKLLKHDILDIITSRRMSESS